MRLVKFNVMYVIYLSSKMSEYYRIDIFLLTGYGYLRFYLGIENLILPMLSYPGYRVRTLHWLHGNS